MPKTAVTSKLASGAWLLTGEPSPVVHFADKLARFSLSTLLYPIVSPRPGERREEARVRKVGGRVYCCRRISGESAVGGYRCILTRGGWCVLEVT